MVSWLADIPVAFSIFCLFFLMFKFIFFEYSAYFPDDDDTGLVNYK